MVPLAAFVLYEIALAPFGWPIIWLGNSSLLAAIAIGLWRYWYGDLDFITIFTPEIVAFARPDSRDHNSRWKKAA